VIWPSFSSILPSASSVGRGAELVATVHQREALRDRREVERPVQCRVAAADDEQALVAEVVHLAHGVMHRCAFIGLDAGHRRTLGLERAAAGRDHDGLRLENLAAVGGDAELGLADALDRLHHLAKVEARLERLDLLHQVVAESLAGDHRQARNVVDRLLGIELGALPADLLKDVDEMGLHVEQAEFEHGKETARAGANDEYVSFDGIGHAFFLSPLAAGCRG
jgi:hypothetical protein